MTMKDIKALGNRENWTAKEWEMLCEYRKQQLANAEPYEKSILALRLRVAEDGLARAKAKA